MESETIKILQKRQSEIDNEWKELRDRHTAQVQQVKETEILLDRKQGAYIEIDELIKSLTSSNTDSAPSPEKEGAEISA